MIMLVDESLLENKITIDTEEIACLSVKWSAV